MRLNVATFAGILPLFALSAAGAVHYVDANSSNSISPYTNWATAAVTIQDAENASTSNDEIIVTNGVYRAGGTADSRISINFATYVHSVNGSKVTIIEGYQTPGSTNGPGCLRCASLGFGVTLAGFTLRNGAAETFGGGVGGNLTTAVSNCIITANVAEGGGGVAFSKVINCQLLGNVAHLEGGGSYRSVLENCELTGNSSEMGGGTYGGTNYNCLLNGNSSTRGGGACFSLLRECAVSNNLALNQGGGVFDCYLTNCLIIGNSCPTGGGVYLDNMNGASFVNCTVVSNSATTGGGVYAAVSSGSGFRGINSIIYLNQATNGPNISDFDMEDTLLGRCCKPEPSGWRTITNTPEFANPEAGDFRLSSHSPCINSGQTGSVSGVDLDGNPRIAGGTIDIGAYEFQSPQTMISYAWLLSYGLPTDSSADHADSDGDGMNNWQEWIANTNPTNSSSCLQLLAPDHTNASPGVTIRWKNTGVTYFIQRGTNLAGPFPTIVSGFTAPTDIATYTDGSATGGGPYFYRIGVTP